jgi:hypothetical protein
MNSLKRWNANCRRSFSGHLLARCSVDSHRVHIIEKSPETLELFVSLRHIDLHRRYTSCHGGDHETGRVNPAFVFGHFAFAAALCGFGPQ